MTARVAFKKRKVVHERVVWIVSVFDDPNDIRMHDGKTMTRLELELYGKNAKSEKHIIIREIIDKKLISHSTLSLDCLLYTSPSPRDVEESRMPSSA